MSVPNLRRCPSCGVEDFRLASIERIEAYAPIDVEGDTATGFTAKWSGMADSTFNWDSAVTLAYACRECGTELPEEYAVLLDTLLTNTRETGGAP